MTCEDGTLQTWFVGMSWAKTTADVAVARAGPGPPWTLTQSLHVHGKVQAIHGSGTLRFTIAALTVDEQAQLCTSGDLTWTVDRTVPPVATPPPAEPLQVLRYVTPDGINITMTRVR